jgi:type IV fimbrial biogenesis protein FimT
MIRPSQSIVTFFVTSRVKGSTLKPHRRGFTLIELMITISLMSILLALAIPSYQRFIQKARIDTEATNLQSFLMSARGEAIKRGQNIWISNGNLGWTGALTAFVDNNGNRTQEATEPTVGVFAAPSEIVLEPNDRVRNGMGYGGNGSIVGDGGLTNGSLGLKVPKLIDNPNYFVGRVSFWTTGRTSIIRFDVPSAQPGNNDD